VGGGMSFTYHRPADLAEACALARRLGADAAYLAGGTELLPDFQRERESAFGDRGRADRGLEDGRAVQDRVALGRPPEIALTA